MRLRLLESIAVEKFICCPKYVMLEQSMLVEINLIDCVKILRNGGALDVHRRSWHVLVLPFNIKSKSVVRRVHWKKLVAFFLKERVMIFIRG